MSLLSNAPGPSTTNAFLPVSQQVSILATYTNEGGIQPNIDLLPYITEEAHQASQPEAGLGRALHLLIIDGDNQGMQEVLEDVINNDPNFVAALCYQNPLNDMKSALHLAVEYNRPDVIWLLLWLGATLSDDKFPPSALELFREKNLPRLLAKSPSDDMRRLRDVRGHIAADLNTQLQGDNSVFAAQTLLLP